MQGSTLLQYVQHHYRESLPGTFTPNKHVLRKEESV